MSPLGRTGTYGCVTRTRYKREKGGSAAIGGTLFRSSWHSPPALGDEAPAREVGRLKKAEERTEREAEGEGESKGRRGGVSLGGRYRGYKPYR